MNVTWLGHSCFLLEADGYRVVIDPYTGVDGYPPLRVSPTRSIAVTTIMTTVTGGE